jgi:DNA helicase-2/ATP-dependent DNA helicase PcrA
MTFNEFKSQFNINLNPQQEAAVQAIDGPVLLLAVPGSGNTTVLVTRRG